MKQGVVALLLVLSACGSAPMHYHTLAAEGPQGATPAASGPKLRVGEVNLPPLLDRQALVSRTGATSLDVNRQEVWAAPLDQMIQQVLTEDLTLRLGADRVLAADDPAVPGGTRTVILSVRQFIADERGNVTLDADWTVQRKGATAVPRHQAITEPGNSTKPDAVVATMSRALARLSDQIAAGQIAGH